MASTLDWESDGFFFLGFIFTDFSGVLCFDSDECELFSKSKIRKMIQKKHAILE